MKWFFSFLIVLAPLFTPATQNSYHNEQQQTVEIEQVYYPWVCEQEGYFGSFWWGVTKYAKNGYYYYTVYITSNSYFNEYDNSGRYVRAITLVEGLNVYAQDYEEGVDFPLDNVVCEWNEPLPVIQFYTDDPNPLITISYTMVTPYHYSKY